MPQDVGSFPTLRDQGDILFGKRKKKPPGVMQMAKKKYWIAGAVKKPGALRAQLGAKPGKPIPAAKLAAAAQKGGVIGKRARLAQTFRGFKKKAAAHGFEGVVREPTAFLTGEGNRPEHVAITPLTGKQAQHVHELERQLERTVTRYQRHR
jgi:hypothetical protein